MMQPRSTDVKRLGWLLCTACVLLLLILNPCVNKASTPVNSSSRRTRNATFEQVFRKPLKRLMISRTSPDDIYADVKSIEHRKVLLRDLVAKATSIVKFSVATTDSSIGKIKYIHNKIHLNSSNVNEDIFGPTTKPHYQEQPQTKHEIQFQTQHQLKHQTHLEQQQEEAETTEPPIPTINYKNLKLCNVTFSLGVCSCNRTITSRLRSCPKDTTTPQEILEHIADSFGESTCGDWATLRGPMQRIVSYTVHGPFLNDYFHGLEELVPRVAEAYPGWNMRVYHRLDPRNDTVKKWVCSLACNYPHLDFCDIEALPVLGNISHAAGRVWRFSVMGDQLVTRYLVRDSDSPILEREVDAVKEWLSSRTCFHMMRDNIFHRTPIMAGMWGGCNDWRPLDAMNIRDNILKNVTDGMQDQAALRIKLWPLARQNVTSHDSFTCRTFPGSQPFPTQRVNYTFVGQRTYRKKYIRDRTFMRCPWRCRPREHPDWLYC